MELNGVSPTNGTPPDTEEVALTSEQIQGIFCLPGCRVLGHMPRFSKGQDKRVEDFESDFVKSFFAKPT